MLVKDSFKTLLTAGALAIAAGAGNAATLSCSTDANGGSDATFYLGNSTQATCLPTDGVSSLNDTNTIDSSFSLFGKTGWVLSDKNDSSDGNGLIEFLTAPINGTKSGDWAIDTLAGLTHVVITLKAGGGFGAFLLDLTVENPLAGTWASTKGLSHASIYYNGTPAPIPLPAAGFLMLGALGGLAALRRSRRAA
jgi:hypothetical protein